MDDALSLPPDMDACRALIADLASRLQSQDTLVGEQSRTLDELQGSREQLTQEYISGKFS